MKFLTSSFPVGVVVVMIILIEEYLFAIWFISGSAALVSPTDAQ